MRITDDEYDKYCQTFRDKIAESEVEERRQLIKLVLSNLEVEDKIVRYDAIKPFDSIIKYADDQLRLRE